MIDTERLGPLLDLFFGYEPEAIQDFRKAVETFKADLPAVLDALREEIDAAYARTKIKSVSKNKTSESAWSSNFNSSAFPAICPTCWIFKTFGMPSKTR